MENQLTPTELELMLILWSLNEASVKDIIAQLPEDRKLAYTSVSTIIRILEKKGIVASKKNGRGHIYFPLVTKEDYEKSSVEHLVEKVFQGRSLALVKYLAEDKKLTKEQLLALEEILND